MKQLWKRYAERIDLLSLRERVMVFSALMVVLLAVVYTAYIDGEVKKEARLSSTIAKKQAEGKALQDQLMKVATSRGLDPDRVPREQLEAVRKQLAGIESQISAEERKFTAPAQMRKVVEELLARNRAIQLVAMKSLPATSIAEARAQAGSKPAPVKPSGAERLIFRHGIEITVSGPYLDLLAYLSDLERLPTQLYWSSLDIDASRYPRHTMKLTVYTLSLDRAWLSV